MKENNSITDKEYWDKYWKNYQYDKIPKKVVFERFMPKLTRGINFIEIGGFPGVNAAYFYRRGIRDVTILDFHINKEIVRNFEKINDLPEGTIQCIDNDFFAFSSEKKYDVVFSSGFIEHFEDTRDAITRHIDLLSEKGQLLIIIPNFLGLNGELQRRFDRENLDSHNLQSMKISYLKEIMQSFNLYDVSVGYLGKPMVWLEPKPENQKRRKWVKMLSYALKLFPVKGKLLSSYIAIYARK
ncbi:Methyltransferase domain-containing protein [Porphyromonadaceae bacterium KH3R12]|uniref:class I SAM-dependent methyltransferase n=1 Tax=Proteiniphilum sp. TaxID=1926877 RepID=UPI000895C1D1|nr:methyltransferase domain-containing protein [Proteiniphilum sp.]MDY9920076.1 methyltransferase domain-containing protein [Proteiniphilum sp.]SDZ72938.1 Methyltransferase domain-containing protein [Porphyromonadaceae bacterium KH3R12]